MLGPPRADGHTRLPLHFPSIRRTIKNSGLRNIQPRAFAKNPHLRYINLSSNRLTTLSWQLFQTLSLRELRLEQNFFNCSCDIRWMQLWQEQGEAKLNSQNLYCISADGSQLPLFRMNISQCDLPEISVSHANLTVREGDNAVITCNGSGSPLPDVDWIVTGLQSINTHQTNLNWTNVHAINLTLVNVTSEDNGFTLTCIAENVVGMSNASVALTVHYPPRVVSLEEPELRLEHCIEFVVRGNPPPTLHWLHNGQPLRESKIIHVEYYQEGEVSEGCLLFNKPTHYNNGNYTLIAKNPLGTANQTINGHFLKEPFPEPAWARLRMDPSRMCPSLFLSPQSLSKLHPQTYSSIKGFRLMEGWGAIWQPEPPSWALPPPPLSLPGAAARESNLVYFIPLERGQTVAI
nr:PREDICTED: NT-3 growth factor receptor-like [Bos indicus]